MAAWRLDRAAPAYERLRAAVLSSDADADSNSPLRGVAAARLLAEETTPSGGRYLAVRHARADGDAEVLEFLLLPSSPPGADGDAGATLCFRAAGARRRRDPPFCTGAGCVNGPPQRARLAALRDALDLSPLEPDDDKLWVPLLLH